MWLKNRAELVAMREDNGWVIKSKSSLNDTRLCDLGLMYGCGHLKRLIY